MDYLTKYYKNLCEQLQEQLNFLQNLLNEEGDMKKDVEDAERAKYDLLPDDEYEYRKKFIPELIKLEKTWENFDSISLEDYNKNNFTTSEKLNIEDKKTKIENQIHNMRSEIFKLKKGKSRPDPRLGLYYNELKNKTIKPKNLI